jgi:hypothetical protein
MAGKKGDLEIGRRAFQEAMRLFQTPKKARERIGVRKSTLFAWGEGVIPGGLYLAKLHYAGADVLYILTGKKSKVG